MGHDHIVGLDTLHVYRFAIDDQPPPSPTPSPNLRTPRQRRAPGTPFRFHLGLRRLGAHTMGLTGG